MAIKTEFVLKDINYWHVKTSTKRLMVYDIISINIGKNFLDIPIFFSRSKSFCFNENLNDYTLVYTPNLGYVKEVEYLQRKIPYLYFDPYINLTREDVYEYGDD